MPDARLADKYGRLLERIERPGPAADRVAEIFRAGKREQLLGGLDAHGVPFAPLKPTTLANPRRRPGGPLIPGGPGADLIVHYQVTVTPSSGSLEVSAGWPFPFVRYLRSGTSRMVARDPGGFRDEDRSKALQALSDHVHGPD